MQTSMAEPSPEVIDRVKKLLATALDRPAEEISLGSSLIDDLGAESIDFLDIQFRLEDEFSVEIEDEIWKGSLDMSDPRWMIEDRVTSEGVSRLKRLQPEYPWDRLGTEVRGADLPRLITVRTIVNFISAQTDSQFENKD